MAQQTSTLRPATCCWRHSAQRQLVLFLYRVCRDFNYIKCILCLPWHIASPQWHLYILSCKQFQAISKTFSGSFPEIKQEITNKALLSNNFQIREQYLHELNTEHRKKKVAIINKKSFFCSSLFVKARYIFFGTYNLQISWFLKWKLFVFVNLSQHTSLKSY